MPTLDAICRYPVKGLNGERLASTELRSGRALRGDRRFAIARADGGVDPHDPAWTPKRGFLMLMNDPQLASIRAAVDQGSGRVTLAAEGRDPVAADGGSTAGRDALAAWINRFLGPRPEGPAFVVEASGFSFSDRRNQALSIVGLDSIADLGRRAGREVDPARFRANLLLRDLAPWEELGWSGARLSVGGAVLRVLKPLGRCPATEVDPLTGERDLDVLDGLKAHYGHTHMGVLAEVVEGGRVAPGDTVTLEA